MDHGFLRTCVAVGVLSLCLAGTSPVAQAGLVISASVGGAPTGVNYANFDGLPLGAAGGVSNGITVTFTGDAQAVQGSLSGVYAAPYLSNGNGALFGDPNNGPDATTYISTGTGSVTLSLPGEEKYVGLLWGSVDTYNTLSLYDGKTLVGTVTGTDVTSSANGDQDALGTFYVNINSTASFDRVVATSTSNAFEFDNVAFNPSAVPEPSSFILALVGIIGVAGYKQMGSKGVAPGNKA
jgi:PEP-CTERM motif